MKCPEVRELLSAYFDEELTSETRAEVAEHLEGCEECSSELAAFDALSGMARELDTPTPPAEIWSQLEQQLELGEDQSRPSVQPASRTTFWSLPMSRLVAVAATVLLVVGLGWVGYSTWFGHDEHNHFTAEFGQYLDEFHRDPAAAQQFLLSTYQGQAVDPDQAVNLVGYRPAIADGLPEGYTVDSTYVMKMPCCTCVQCVCTREDGSTIVVFEHDDEEMEEWFGDRPESSATCSGKQCMLVDLDDRIAASWKRDTRHMTVVGLQDISELTALVAWFDDRGRITPQ